jgi:D-alanyl-D-alanine carboxypeptidase (penicillin-binding protein 5/6)
LIDSTKEEPIATRLPPGPPDPPATDGAPPESGEGQRRSHRLAWSLVTVSSVIIVGLVSVEAWHVTRPLPAPTASSTLASVTVPGGPPVLPWPTTGQGAVSIPSLGFAASSSNQASHPIASLTKLATAVVILRDHPVPANTSGPSLTMTQADVNEYESDESADGSVAKVAVGEVLTEREMLEGLLALSANNLADTLAIWDAGSEAAFVVKMNALAASLGMTDTHYVDDSGVDPGSVSSAADVLKVAAAGMAIPTFAEVVAMPSVTLPLIGTQPNLVTEIGSFGVVGIKSGYTSEAGGCMVLAGQRVIDGRTAIVLIAVIAQPVPAGIPPPTTTTTTTTTTALPGSPPPPPTTTTPPTTIPEDELYVPDPEKFTRPVAESLRTATESTVVPVVLASSRKVVGTAMSTWGGVKHHVSIVTSEAATLLAWPGQTIVARHSLSVPSGGQTGARVGTISYTLGTQSVSVPLRLSQAVSEPSLWWRLTHR